MSSFQVLVSRVYISEHTNAENLEIGTVGDYHIVVGKGHWQDGDLGVYIPEQSIVPQNIIEEMELVGRLAGADKNRVKAIRLRGEVSQGLLYKPSVWPDRWVEGLDVRKELNIVKYEQPIPVNMSGIQLHSPTDFLRTYTDIENIKAFPNVLLDGETISVCEKLHGSLIALIIDDNTCAVSSKGISAKGLVLADEPGNVYWRVTHQYNLFDRLQKIKDLQGWDKLILFGEVVGVQDLRYNLGPGQLAFYAFDIYGPRGYTARDEFLRLCTEAEIPRAPSLYYGPYSKEKVLELTSGDSVIPDAEHIREGVVIRAEPPRYDEKLGRVILKSISNDYLLRKGNQSELQ